MVRTYPSKEAAQRDPAWLAELALCWAEFIRGDEVTGLCGTFHNGITAWINDALAAERHGILPPL